MKRTALSLAVLCSLLLTACSTAEIPQTVPENSTSYDQTASYAQNLGRQFGILKISDGMTGAEQCSRVRTESHLARNLGVTLLANSPLQDLSKSVSKGPFSTGVGLDFANLGWKNDTVYFENLDHWFAFVPQQKYLSKEAAQSYTVQALAEATVAVFSQNSYVVDDIRTSELEQSGDTLRQSVQIKLVNETVGCSKSRKNCSMANPRVLFDGLIESNRSPLCRITSGLSSIASSTNLSNDLYVSTSL